MKRALPLLCILTVLCIALCASLLLCRTTLAKDPFATRETLPFPDNILPDGDGLFMTVESSRHVLKLDGAGRVQYSIDCGGQPGQGFSQAWMMERDEQGTLYLFDSRSNPEDYNIQSEHILAYDAAGHFRKEALAFDYGDERPTMSHILAYEVGDGILTYLYWMGKEEADIVELNLATGEKKTVASIPIGDDLSDISSLSEYPLYFTTKRGAIFRVEKEGAPEAIALPTDGSVVYPNKIRALADGEALFTDVATAKIMRLDSEGRFSVFLSADTLRRDGYPHETVLFERVQIAPDGSVLTLDTANKTLLRVDASGKLLSSVDRLAYPFSRTAFRLLYWAQIPLLVILAAIALRIAHVRLLRRRVPLVLKQLAIYIPLLLAFTILIAVTVYRDSNKRYREGVEQRLLGFAQVLARSVDGDALDRIYLPEHFQDEDYVAIQGKLLGLLNNAEDSWNADLSFVIYRKYGGIFHYIVTMWDYVGTLYPTTYVSPSHSLAWDKGEIHIAEYTDPDSDWLSAIAPVVDSAGKTAGILEVYVDKMPIAEKESAARQKLAFQIAAAAISFIVAVALVTVFLTRFLGKLTRGMDSAAEGDLRARIGARSADELGDISNRFDRFLGDLGGLVTGTRRNLADLSAAGEKLADHMTRNQEKTGEISRRIAESKSGIAERADALRQSLSSIDRVSASVTRLDELILRQEAAISSAFDDVEAMAAQSRQAADRSEESVAIVGELVSAAQGGKELQAEVVEAVKEVAVHSQGLSELNGVIASIAEQTNLLAMNAAIEAAHAGDAGRGFAVVADEVRKLSEESSRQSGEIQAKLSALMERVNSFDRITAQTSEAFGSIQARVADVERGMAELTKAALDTAAAGAAIKAALAEILDAARGAAAGSMEMKAGSESLEKLIGNIETMIDIVGRNLDDITLQAGGIDQAAQASSELTRQNSQSIRAVVADLEHFKA